MDVSRIQRVIERIEAADARRLGPCIAARRLVQGEVVDEAATAQLVQFVRDYIRIAPEVLKAAAAWARTNGVEQRYRPAFAGVESYFCRPDDEVDEQRDGLFGLLDDAYLALRMIELMGRDGMPLPGDLKLADRNTLARALLGEDVTARLEARIKKLVAVAAGTADLQSGAKTLPRSVPAPAFAPSDAATSRAAAQDPLLIGMWNHHSYYSSGGFSYSHTRSRLLYRNGRYVEGTQSFVTMISRNSSGDETGQTHGSNVSSDDRGDWSGADGILTLAADNGDAYEFRYKIEGNALMLSQPGRDPQLWQH